MSTTHEQLKMKKLGQTIKEYRLRSKITITELARLVDKDRSYLSKVEHGHEKPTANLLNDIIRELGIQDERLKKEIFMIAGYTNNTIPTLREEVRKDMTEQAEIKTEYPKTEEAQVNLDPRAVQVLYTDSAFVTSSQWGIVLDFAQTAGPTNQQNVVARVGMSREHAKALVTLISKYLEPSIKTSGGKN